MRKRVWRAGIVLSTILALCGFAANSASAAGGVNNGQPGSTCSPSDAGLIYTPPGPGVATTGIAGAPAYYELGQPAGAFVGQPPKGLMIAIHGGGWWGVGRSVTALERPAATLWRNRGWLTLNIDYRGCAQSFPDVLWFHDAARQLVGPALPLCVTGVSSGAHLALMMASSRPDVACVIAEGPPANLLTLPNQTAYNPVTRKSDQTAGPRRVYYQAVAAFGESQLAALSPALHPGRARLLLATATQDSTIPTAQGQEMAAAATAANPGTYADVDQLAPGLVIFTHVDPTKGTGVSRAAYNDYLVRQLKTVAPVIAPAGVTNPVINDIRVPALLNASVGNEEFNATVLPTCKDLGFLIRARGSGFDRGPGWFRGSDWFH